MRARGGDRIARGGDREKPGRDEGSRDRRKRRRDPWRAEDGSRWERGGEGGRDGGRGEGLWQMVEGKRRGEGQGRREDVEGMCTRGRKPGSSFLGVIELPRSADEPLLEGLVGIIV